MTAKEYLGQAYRIEQKIQFAYDELNRLKELAENISSPQLEEKVQTTKSIEAPFEKYVIKITEEKEKIKTEIEQLIKLKNEISTVIESVKDYDEKAVLKCRHIYNYSWPKTAEKLNISRSSALRLYAKAIKNLKIPQKLELSETV